MSLINQVLKDLDDREPLSADKSDRNYQAVNHAPEKPPTDWVRLAVWAVVVICIAGAAAYWFYLQQQVPETQEFKPVQATLSAPPQPAAPVEVEPVVVDAKPVEPVGLPPEKKATVPAISNPPVITNPPAISKPSITKTQVAGKKPEEEAVAYLPLKNTGLPVKSSKPKAVKANQPAKAVETKRQPPDAPDAPDVKVNDIKFNKVVKVKTALPPLEEARQLLNNGRLTEAEKKLKSLVKKQPLQKQPRELLIGLLLRNSRTTEAEQQLSEALRIYPRHENFVLLNARFLLEKQDTNALLVLLENHIKSGKAGTKSISMLASLYQQKKKFVSASQIYNRLAKAEPEKGSHWLGLAISLEAQGQKTNALKSYQQAIQSGGITSQLQQYAVQRINVLRQQVTENE